MRWDVGRCRHGREWVVELKGRGCGLVRRPGSVRGMVWGVEQGREDAALARSGEGWAADGPSDGAADDGSVDWLVDTRWDGAGEARLVKGSGRATGEGGRRIVVLAWDGSQMPRAVELDR